MPKTITTEKVSYNHPDKIADSICDFVLGKMHNEDKLAKSSINALLYETPKAFNLILTGKIESNADPLDVISKDDICTFLNKRFNVNNEIKIFDHIDYEYRNDENIKKEGGYVMGFASNETNEHKALINDYAEKIQSGVSSVIENNNPILKTTVSLKKDGDDIKITNVDIDIKFYYVMNTPKKTIIDKVNGTINDEHKDESTNINIKMSTYALLDNGVSGRKLSSDMYGPCVPDNGGSPFGKDMSELDRGGKYLARYIAVNVVDIGKFDKAEVYLSYSQSQWEPTSIYIKVYMFGHSEVVFELPDYFYDNIRNIFPVDRRNMYDYFNEDRVIYDLSCSDQFSSKFLWERTDKSDELKNIKF